MQIFTTILSSFFNIVTQTMVNALKSQVTDTANTSITINVTFRADPLQLKRLHSGYTSFAVVKINFTSMFNVGLNQVKIVFGKETRI